MRIRKDMLAVSAFERQRNAAFNEDDLPNTGCGIRPCNVIVDALAHCAIGVSTAVRVKVRELYCGAEDQQNCEYDDGQNSGLRTRCS
jgi:hypothetical protein